MATTRQTHVRQEQGELERTLGLGEALAIGVGTMVGAGIFVFPGIAAGNAGPAAILSFLMGAGIALLVAFPASELATAMPQSGGGYYFVSRGMGTLAGCTVGIGQWIGLMFASAFYLVGFGHYLNDLFNEMGVPVLLPDPDPLPQPLEALLGRLDVIILGVFEVPRQTAMEQARDQFGEEARQRLDAWMAPLDEQGGALETRLVFSPAPIDTIERVAAEERADAILVPGAVGHEHIEHVLVPVRSPINRARITKFVAALIRHSGADVTVLHVVEEDEEEGEVLAAYREHLRKHGVANDQILTHVARSDQPVEAIIDVADENDIIVLGESKPSVVETIMGTVPRHITREAGRPVLVVRYPDEERERADRAAWKAAAESRE